MSRRHTGSISYGWSAVSGLVLVCVIATAASAQTTYYVDGDLGEVWAPLAGSDDPADTLLSAAGTAGAMGTVIGVSKRMLNGPAEI